MTSRRTSWAPLVGVGLAATLIAGLASRTLAADPAAARSFTRVHVPRDALGEVSLGDARYLPLPRPAFEAAVNRAAGSGPTAAAPGAARADAARYDARVTPAGMLVGRVAFDVGSEAAAAGEVSLGGLSVARCTAGTAAGVGDVVVFCRPDGSRAAVPVGPGEYVAAWAAPRGVSTVDGVRHRLPLVPAVRSTIRLEVPPGLKPVPVGLSLPARRDGAAWIIEAAMRDDVEFFLVDEGRAPPRLAAWTAIDIAGRQVALETACGPDRPWGDEPVVLEKDPAVVVTKVAVGAGDVALDVAWHVAPDSRSITLHVPPAARGSRTPVVLSAIGPLPDGMVRPLPVLRPRAQAWIAGGAVVRVEPALALAGIDLVGYLAVTAEAAAAWPVPAGAGPGDADGLVEEVLPARVFLEQQAPAAEIRLAVEPRSPRLDMERAAIVDFAPGVVVGTTTCDVGVERGEAFGLEGLVAPGWFIDTVDVVGWSRPLGWPDAGTAAVRPAEAVDWKVVRGPRGDLLRVGLATAITPDRRLRLRIAGHRAGAAAGAAFTASEIDMVQFPAAASGPAVIGFRTNAERAIEIDGAAVDASAAALADLIADSGIRSWVATGPETATWQVRIVQRRPPLDVQAQVRLTARDDRLSQSFTFECRPDTSDLDGLVVRFSEPMDDRLEWSLLAPANGGIVARRLESADESWLVEFTPPIREAVTIRATRTVPFTAPVPVPLAWVEGAARQVGEVIVRDAGRRRPRLVNRRLAELPPRAGSSDRWPTLVGMFSFVGERDAGPMPAAELVPGAHEGEDARAWAWREIVSCWCHTSGRTEFETVYEIESQGRSSLVIGLPADRQLQGVEIDGVAVPIMQRDDVAAVPVDLPAGRSSLRLVVRTVAESGPPRGWWRVEPEGVAVDLPVLDRLIRLHLPPALEVVPLSGSWRDVAPEPRGVLERLAGASLPRGPAGLPTNAGTPASEGDPSATAFRMREFVPTAGRAANGFVIVERRWLGGAAVVAGILVAAGVLLVARRRRWWMPLVCVAAGVAALWSPVPIDGVARAGWWAAVGATGWVLGRSILRRPGRLAACALIAAAGSGAPLAGLEAAEPLRVFITPGDDGETALVPESLYRALARDSAAEGTAVRVVTCRLVAASAADEGPRWRAIIEFDAAAAGVLSLGAAADEATWIAESPLLDGRPVRLTGPEGRDVAVSGAGRHRLEAELIPRVEVVGEVEMLSAAVPRAPTATLVVADGAGDAESVLECAVATEGGAWIAISPGEATQGGGAADRVYDVSGAGRVRLVQSRIPGVGPAAGPPTLDSRNDVVWDLDACRVTASYAIDPGRAVAGAEIVHADDGLELVEPADPGIVVAPLGENRWSVRSASPAAGPWRFELAFRRPLADPVGRFRVPAAWIEGRAIDRRTVRVTAAGDLAVQVEAPAGFSAAPLESNAWQVDLRPRVDGLAGGPSADDRLTISTERRRQEPRGTQDVRVRFLADRTVVSLDARFDSASAALVALPVELPPACVVDSIQLFDDDLQSAEPDARGPIEAQWRRSAADRGTLTVQRPRAGRFRLAVTAHIAAAPAATGRLPVVRVALATAPAVASWNESPADAGGRRSWELRSDERPPLYALRTAAAAEQPPPSAAADAGSTAADRGPRPPPIEPRIELADIDVSLESRGRAWGRARFDVVAGPRLMRLAIPTGMRLFDVLVDGQPTATVTPAVAGGQAGDEVGERWDVRLHDTSWPRSIEVVYAGTLGGGDDGPVVVAAPVIIGLPSPRPVWTLRAPADKSIHVVGPGRPASAEDVAAERAAALAAIDAGFDAAIAAAEASDRDRLREALEARRARLESDFAADRSPTRLAEVVRVVGGGDARLAIRIARRRDPTLLTRAWATLALLAVGSGLWIGIRRRLAG